MTERNDSFSARFSACISGCQLIFLVLAMFWAVSGAMAQRAEFKISGSWTGQLTVGGINLPLVFTITSSPDGVGSTMDSPKQGVKGIPAGPITVSGDEIRIGIPAINGYFSGKISENGEQIAGSWNQAGSAFPMMLSRMLLPFVLDRPQEPRPPFPYSSSEVRISSKSSGVELAGTLVMPPGAGPFPAIVMVSGSGAQNRDEEILGHKPFLVLADYLARRGIASLRYDDRGFGSSTGDFAGATTLDFADDAVTAFWWLRAQPGIDPGRSGILGHSEGGIIAPIAATREPGIHFLVLLASPGVPGSRILESQGELIARASGESEVAIAESRQLNKKLYAEASRDLPVGELLLAVRTVYMEGIEAMSTMNPAEKAEALHAGTRIAAELASPWFRTFLALDPAVWFRSAATPVLALNGSKDLQVPGVENLEAIRVALPDPEKAASRFILLDGLNHLFQHAGTGLPEEYGDIAETFAPEALSLVGDWILDQGN